MTYWRATVERPDGAGGWTVVGVFGTRGTPGEGSARHLHGDTPLDAAQLLLGHVWPVNLAEFNERKDAGRWADWDKARTGIADHRITVDVDESRLWSVGHGKPVPEPRTFTVAEIAAMPRAMADRIRAANTGRSTPEAVGTDRGDWMQTFAGHAFYPMTPHTADIDPRDIAHALAMICRYGGHVQRFYSVAEHCVLMSHAVAPGNALWALLHDATEAYVGDMVRPLKHSMPAYRAAEHRLMAVICERFGLDPSCPAEVKAADNRILVDERDELMGPPPLPWASTEGVEALGVPIYGWMPAEAKERYLARLGELWTDGAR